MDLSIEINPAQWIELEEMLGQLPGTVQRAAVAAVNKTGATGATRIRRRLAGSMGIGVRTLGNRVRWWNATSKIPHGKIRLAEYNVKAIKMGVTPVRGGSYPLKKIASPVLLSNTPFQQTMPSGHLGWFVRYGTPRQMQSGRYVGRVREPIVEVWVPGAASVWEQAPNIATAELSSLGEVLQKNLDSQISRFLKGRPGAAAATATE